MRHIAWRTLLVLACWSAGAGVAFGQAVYGTIRGALTSASGAPITEAVVLVSALDKGDQLRLSAQTDASGFYIFSSVPPGVYTITMRKPGYKTHEEPVVAVSADTTSEVNVRLLQGNSADKELGDGSAISILKIDRTDVSTIYSRGEIAALPVLQQDLSQYEELVAGAISTRSVLSAEQNLQNGSYVSISGQHFSGTTFVLDGTTNRDPVQGIVVLNPSPEAVSELKVTTQNYGAEFGPATAGIVSMQTRSGSNALHGSAFGYRQSGFGEASFPDFSGTSFLTDSSRKRTEFGGTLGGPLVKDRLFLFGDYRGVRNSNNGTVLLTVPTKTVQDTCGVTAQPNCNLSEYLQGGVIFSPSYANGMLPNNILSPQMLAFLKTFPLPNNGTGLTNNFTAAGVESYNADSSDVRADFVASARLRIFGRYSFAQYGDHGTPAFGVGGGLGTNPEEFAGTVRNRIQGIGAGFSYNLSPGLVTDFRFGFLRYNLTMDSLDAGTSPATAAGIDGLNLPGNFYTSGMPDIQLVNPNLTGLPIAGDIDFMRLGYSSAANTCNCPLREREQQFQFVNNWTKLWRTHGFRWGADIRYLQNFLLSSITRRAGHLQFDGSFTGFSLGDFLLGVSDTFDRTYNPTLTNAGERQTRLFFYGEDTWRVSSRLTLNYGLRWEVYLPQSATETGGGGWLALGSGATPVDDLILVAGQNGANLRGNVKTTLQNFGPHVGLAYLVNTQTVIRAGYARAFDPGYGGTIFGIATTQSPPVSVVAGFPAGFTVNSAAQPTAVNSAGQPLSAPFNICILNGACTVPPFLIPPAPFTVRDLISFNSANSGQPTFYALPRRMRLPTVDAWNLTMQHALDRQTYLEIAYVGNHGTHVLNDAFNQVPYYDLNEPSLAGFIAKTQPGKCTSFAQVRKNPYCKTTVVSRQPFQPLTAEVRYFGNTANSSYNSLQVKVRRQFTPAFSMLAAYTWAKVLDHDNIYYANDPAVGFGLGNFDRAHNFVMTNTWSLPFGRGRSLWGSAGPALNAIVGGWSLGAVTSLSSGFPFTPTYLECVPDVGPSAYKPCRPNLVAPVHITGRRSQYFTTTGGVPLAATCAPPVTPTVTLCPPKGVSTLVQGFDTSTGESLVGQTIGPWQRPGAGQVGDAGRNSLRGPGFFQADLSVAKEVSVTERVAVRFRADAFNVFNQVNLGNPQSAVDSPTGGQINFLAPGASQRQLQFSLRVDF